VAISITGGMASSPGDALDAHAHLLPVHLLIDKVLYRAALRFTTLPPTHPLYEAVKNAALRHVKRHPTPLHYLLNNYPGLKPHLVETIAATRMKPTWTPNLAIRVADTKERAKQEDEVDRARVKVYLDGSGLEGEIGAAAVLYRDGELKAVKRYKLGSERHHTVYEGEGIGMLLGMELLREERDEVGGMVPLCVDSQAAIAATSKIKPAPSHYIWDAFHRHLRAATGAHPNMDLLLRWTPGHMDIEGNELADFHAKSAILEGPSGALPKFLQRRLPKSRSALRQARNAKLQKVAAARWRKSPRYARLVNIDPTLPSPSYLKLIANLPRKHAAILFQLRTGHAPLAKHLYRLQKAETPTCPSCRMYDDTVDHFLLFCPAHDEARRLMLHEGGLDTQHKSRLLSQARLLPHLFRFIARSGRMRAVYGDLPDLPDPEPAK
jgi:ribonuclease HI